MRRGAGAAWLALVVCTLTGCQRDRESASSAPSAAPSASVQQAPPTPTAPAAPTAASATEPPPTTLGAPACRAMTVKGAARTAQGTPLAPMTPLDGETPIELERGAEVALRFPASAREIVLRGPGRLLPCRKGAEQLLVVTGTVVSAPGTGVRPGAELWIGTPFGSVRYGDAAFELSVQPTQWTIQVRSGTVWTTPPPKDRGRPADGRWTGGEKHTARGVADPDALVRECQSLAERARSAAQDVLAGGARGLGERARAQLLMRQQARGACLAAAAAALRVEDPARRSRLEDQIRHADALWESVPRRTPAPNPAASAGDAPLTVQSSRR